MKMTPAKDLDPLLERYRQGKCTQKELSLLLLWMEQLDIRDPSHFIPDEAQQAMQDKMYRHIINRPAKRATPVIGIRRWGWIAASVLLMVGIFTLTRYDHKEVAQYRRIDNPGKGVKEITMPDGTHIWLNGMATLEVEESYDRKDRKLRLQGEAFFEVARRNDKPFMVQTGLLSTQVLGTSFNIEAYNTESEIRIALSSGSVQIEDNKAANKILLHPGEMVRYKKAAGSMQVLPVSAHNIQGWIEGGLVFNELPLSEALQRVEQHYGIHIIYNPKLLENKRVTAACSRHDNWPAILKTMLFVHDLNYYQRADTVYIK